MTIIQAVMLALMPSMVVLALVLCKPAFRRRLAHINNNRAHMLRSRPTMYESGCGENANTRVEAEPLLYGTGGEGA